MKKVVLSVVALLAITFANAQDAKDFSFSQGDVLVEGNLGFGSTNDKNTEEKTNTFSITPSVAYFLTDKFAVGAQLGYTSDKREVAGIDTDKESEFDAGVFGRYYFLDLGQRFKTYADAGVGFTTIKDDINDTKVNGFGAGVGLGINYFVTERIVLNFALRNIISYQSVKPDGGENVSQFGFDLNGNIANPFSAASFGVGYKF
ncbi:OmpW family outer membrane protein [Flavobacterium seoulense]|uniref:Outer membrane protein beta-barrel domain-containing protein n=1 Tax=Flavobacterium seoulense TaxID=1492738 RepID=A0A066WUE0_9FLAO|nr:OmpW family outer membrane protein [Flavobacterium seoulense]KDN54280.1 hypothetical protein FEM21_25310 [Flavobacterium seoulense]